MLLETEKERVCINKKVGQNKIEVTVEGDVIVNDIKPDVLNIISADGIPCIYKKEVMDGKIRIDGSVNTYIMYFADDENSTSRSLNTVLDFTQIIDIDGCMPGMTANVTVEMKNIECRVLNGRKINVRITLTINSRVYSNDNIEIISNINNFDDVQVLNNARIMNALIGGGNTRVYAKDTISVDIADEIAEVMKANIRIVNKDIKLSYNKVLAKADADVLIIYLTEDNRIKNINTKIPVMGFVDIENIRDEAICDVDYQIKNLIIKPNNVDLHSIYVEAEIEISCYAYETRNINLIEDLYSVSSNLNFTQKQMVVMSGKENISQTCEIKEQINIPELEGNKVHNIRTIPKILNATRMNGKIIYEGEILIEVLFEMNNNINSRNIQVPFNFNIISDNIAENCILDTDIDVIRDDFIVNGSNMDANVGLQFNVSITQSENVNIIDEITLEENTDNDIYSMVIYFVKPGDTLWKIAKKFRSTIEDIARVNGIENEDKIYVGQQLYIPKFVKNNIAV